MSKIKKKMLESMNLQHVPDAADGSRVAINGTTQLFTGEKEFKDGASVLKDPLKSGKNLITLSDLNEVVNKVSMPEADIITLTAGDIALKQVSLSHEVDTGAEGLVKFKTNGSSWFMSGVHFNVNENVISWRGFSYTESHLLENDIIVVCYMAKAV